MKLDQLVLTYLTLSVLNPWSHESKDGAHNVSRLPCCEISKSLILLNPIMPTTFIKMVPEAQIFVKTYL